MLTAILAGTAATLSLFADFEVQPRTGDWFLSTRTPYAASYGMRFYDLGHAWAPTLVAPAVLCPLGLGLAAVDKFALSPVWDVLCLPCDAVKRAEADAPGGVPPQAP